MFPRELRFISTQVFKEKHWYYVYLPNGFVEKLYYEDGMWHVMNSWGEKVKTISQENMDKVGYTYFVLKSFIDPMFEG